MSAWCHSHCWECLGCVVADSVLSKSMVGVLLLFLVGHVCCDYLVTVLCELVAILGLLVVRFIMGWPCCLTAARGAICRIVMASCVTGYRLYVAYPTFSATAAFVCSGSFVIRLIDVSFLGLVRSVVV